MMLLPLNASIIWLEWQIEEGGFGVTACTDRAGLPVIGLYTLNPQGYPTGDPVEFAHEQFEQRIVVGRNQWQHVITVIAEVTVDHRGLTLYVRMPQHMIDRGYVRYLFRAWDSQPP